MAHTSKILWLTAALSMTLACGPTETNEPSTMTPGPGKGDVINNDPGTDDPIVCAAVRGNGPLIFAHFAGMARLHEHHGMILGVAGGSSASITSFLTESMYANPHIETCGDQACSNAETGHRVALLFKSIFGYLQVIQGSDEAIAFQQLAPVLERAKAQGVGDLVEQGNFTEANAALQKVLESDDLRALINPEVLDLLANSPNPELHVSDVWASLESFGKFDASDPKIFVQPGIIDFGAFAEKIGRIGSFYAAYGESDPDAWQAFLNDCSTPAVGKGWPEIAALPSGDSTCGARFDSMARTWRDAWIADEANQKSRIDDPIGTYLPALISTSVLTGDAVSTFAQARTDYLAATPFTLNIGFDDVQFGYWGQEADLRQVEKNDEGYTDLKTQKFLSLGQETYRTALSFSPAEPGLTRALEIDDSRVSAGGWSDLAPTLVLRNMGCEKVFLITRRDDVQDSFAGSVATLLGMDAQESDALFNHQTENSSINVSLDAADAVWCTDWNNVDSFDFGAAFLDSYTAPMQTSDPFFSNTDYPNVTDSVGVKGCTSGATE